ncbi:hypothetical protein, partial [Rhizobium sophoriradicis]
MRHDNTEIVLARRQSRFTRRNWTASFYWHVALGNRIQPVTGDVAVKLECPDLCKVEMSLWSASGRPISPDLSGWSGLQ